MSLLMKFTIRITELLPSRRFGYSTMQVKGLRYIRFSNGLKRWKSSFGETLAIKSSAPLRISEHGAFLYWSAH